ncbi:MAG TPA: amino acid adenylation domain-containing protein [Candidatus Angelobacter sp.]|jgi:amino acid adenylation domain-containing protein|nr:amino acid adenylation domain-containing protein [Candidatus Angelobacter sp.]
MPTDITLVKDDIKLRKSKNANRRERLSPEKQAQLKKLLKRGTEAGTFRAIPQRPQDLPVPLSFAQQRLWFVEQMTAGTAVYNLPVTIQLDGTLNAAALQQSLSEVARRHESLRTTYVDYGQGPVQIVASHHHRDLPLVDLAGLSPSERNVEAQRIALTHNQRPFAIAQDAPLRKALLRLGPEKHILVLAVHHIAADGWSLQLLVKEVAALYQAFSAGQCSPLPEAPIQYADYSCWQRQRLQGNVLESLVSYWKQQLDDIPPLLQLPADHPRPAVASFRGETYKATIPEKLAEQIKLFCQKERVTLFTALLASFQVLLSRYSGQDDILIGTPVAGRSVAETEALIGLFVNTVVMRANLSDRPAVRQLLNQVRETVLEAQTHQELPFERLVEELKPERNLSYSPVFQAMLVLQNVPQESMNVPGLHWNSMVSEPGVEEFDLTLSVNDDKAGLQASLSYSTDLFNRETIERLINHWQQVLAVMVANPGMQVTRIPLLTLAEETQILRDWNATAADYGTPKPVHTLFEEQALATPAAIAVDFEGRQVNYAELNNRVNQVARYLIKQGAGAETRVGVCLERGVDLVAALLGILKAGASYVPLDPQYPAEHLAMMAKDASLSALVTHSQLSLAAAGLADVIVEIDKAQEQIAQETGSTGPSVPLKPESLAYIIYTSGSTGKPKGVMVEHRQVYNQLMWVGRALGLSSKDRMLQKASYSFDASIIEIFLPLISGAQLVIAKPRGERDIEYLVQLGIDKEITHLDLPPSLLEALLEYPKINQWTALRVVCCGGEVLNPQLVASFYQSLPGTTLWNTYGPTETTVQSIVYVCREAETTVPIGKPLANTQVYVLDAEMQPVPIGVAGELFIGGAGVARGYWNRADLTLQKFIPDPFTHEADARLYRTGDWVKWRTDGNLEFLGRRDTQVKLRGYRIELGEIETILRHCEDVKDTVVAVKKDHNGSARLVSYVVMHEKSTRTDTDLRQFLQDKLPEHMVPAVFVRLQELPLSANGKIDRLRLPEPEQDSHTVREAFAAPRNSVEEILAGIWSQVLSVGRISRTDNFFSLGGHSLLATQVTSRIRERFRVEVPIRALFEAPVLMNLAERIEEAMRSPAESSLPRLRPFPKSASVPASHAQERLWFLHQLDPDSSAYNISTAIQLDAEVSLAALEQSLGEVVRRHDSLRTTFTSEKGHALQEIHPHQALKLPLVNLGGLGAEEQIAEVKRITQQESLRPFDLSKGPLFRTHILQLNTQYTLLVTMHHIISDGWSMGVLTKEVEALHNAFCAGLESPLNDLEIQYSDYSQWQREYLQGEYLERELSYWKPQLAGAPTVLELQTDRPRPAIRTQGGVQIPIELSPELARDLQEFGKREGSTTFMTLMAAFHALLARYTGQDDLLVGSPVAGRGQVELESLIGFFVNMVVFRSGLRSQPTFRNLVKQVRESALGAYAHQDFPFEKLVEELQPERSMGRNPLFQVILAFQNAPMPALQMGGATLPSGSPATAEMKFDLELYFWEDNGRLSGSLVYSPELFDSDTIERFARHFQILLQKAVAQPAVPLSDINVMESGEFRQIVEEWNATVIGFQATACVHELFERQVERTPGGVALRHDQQQMTYQELHERSNLLANYLRNHGVGPEVLVAVCIERSPEMIVALLAILKAGGAYVPLDPEFPADRLAYILADAQVPVLLTQEGCLQKLPSLTAKTICLDKDWDAISQESNQDVFSGVASDNLAYVIYTSGSTGHPKGVMINHASLVNLITWHNRQYGITPADRAIQLAGLAFDAATWEIWPYLIAGASLFLPKAKSYEIAIELKNWLKEQEISICFLSTPLAEAVIPGLPSELPLKYVLTGGDRLHQMNKELGFQLVNHYGPTEITVLATCAPVGFKSLVPPIGKPIANTAVYILDRNMQPVPVGSAGEIYVGGSGVGRGYRLRPDLTAEYFLPDPFSGNLGARIYRTGDMGRYLPDGTIEYRGRKDHQVKIRGFRIELGEIESALKQEPEVREAVVLARQDGPGERQLVAYVVTQSDSVTSEKLRTALKNKLPEYMVPVLYVFLKELPMTTNGKVNLASLPAPDFSLVRSEKNYVEPKNPLQQQLVEIWGELLSARPIGITDDFFELGGHSLLAVQLIARIEERLNKRIPMASLFQGATIEHLAQAMGQAPESQSWSPLVPMRPEGTRKPVYVVHAAGGHLLAYSDVVRNWWPDQPLYGLQSRETNKELLPHTQIEPMAAEYVAAIRSFQPSGPYYLAGWSMGGVIAFEMARQLQQQGQKVALLALFDPEAPAEKPAEYNRTMLLGSFATDLGLTMETLRATWTEIASLPPMQQLTRIWSLAKKSKLVSADMTLMAFRNLFDAFKMNAQMMRSYVGGPLDGRITLFRPENAMETFEDLPETYYSTDEVNAWNRLAVQGVETLTSPGQHFTMMQEPHVKTLIEKLRVAIDNAAKEF